VTPRARVLFGVSLAALGAATVVVLGAALSGGGAEKTRSARPRPRPGSPPLVLDLGVRTDPQALALERAARLYDAGKRRRALAIFERYRSPEARVGAAFAVWPDDSLARLEQLSQARPDDGFVLLHLGLARFWSGRTGAAQAAWRAAKRRDPDSASAVRADDLLHPNTPRGVPIFVPSFSAPASLARLSAPRQLAALVRGARTGGVRRKLLYGVALQRLGHRVSAEREYAAAAAVAPSDPEANVAAAVGLFDKDRPAVAFSRLGPLVRRFPRAPTVRFHLGLLLLWLGEVRTAKRELRFAYAEGPSSPLGREAKSFLARLESIRTK
jgi:Flp pilus assembly protein TadD